MRPLWIRKKIGIAPGRTPLGSPAHTPERGPARPSAGLILSWPLSPVSIAWECPRCSLIRLVADATPRCDRCGFWDTAS